VTTAFLWSETAEAGGCAKKMEIMRTGRDRNEQKTSSQADVG